MAPNCFTSLIDVMILSRRHRGDGSMVHFSQDAYKSFPRPPCISTPSRIFVPTSITITKLDYIQSSMPNSPASEHLPRYTTHPPRTDMPRNFVERLRGCANIDSQVLALTFIISFEFACTLSIMWYIYKNVEQPLAKAQLLKVG